MASAPPAAAGPAGAWARFKSFASRRRHDFPGVLALAVLALLENLSTQFFAASDQINQHGLSYLTDGNYQALRLDFYVGFGGGGGGVAGLFLPFVIAAWLLGKHRPIRVLFLIAIWVALFNIATSTINVLGTINQHTGNVGAATLLADAGLLWLMNVIVFALWYWSTDAGGPDRRGTPAERRPDFDFPQQRHETHGWQGWVPGFHDYLHAAFTISLTFHAAGAEILSGRTKYVNMLQSTISVTILLLLVAKSIATFTPGG